MKGTASKKAQDILRGYVESIKDTKETTVRVTTYCYDNFAQGVRAIMPDVDEDTIDQMYAAIVVSRPVSIATLLLSRGTRTSKRSRRLR